MTISIIVAVADNGVIGRNNDLPWHQMNDLLRFKTLTMGKRVIMGRKTFESLDRPLEGRRNIVLSRDPSFVPQDGFFVARSMEEALDIRPAKARRKDRRVRAWETMVIGGSSVFEEALPLANRIHMTWVHCSPEGDTFFPSFNIQESFYEVERDERSADEHNQFDYTFLTFQRKVKEKYL